MEENEIFDLPSVSLFQTNAEGCGIAASSHTAIHENQSSICVLIYQIIIKKTEYDLRKAG